MTASAYINGFHQVSLIQTAAAIRLNSSTAAAVNFTLSICERLRISSLERRRGISRRQESPSFAERATTASVIRYSPERQFSRRNYLLPIVSPSGLTGN